jgi:protocatechuate 3,4-dioxygenase alpha subunit
VTLARTPSQTVGPYYTIGLCRPGEHELVDPSDPGAVTLSGSLLDGDGAPVTDGMVEIWQPVERRWGRSGTHPDGTFSFVLTKPAAAPGEAPHLDVYVFARGLLEHRLTRIYWSDEADANGRDAVFSALAEADRALLVAVPEDGGLRFDIRLQGERQTVFFSA